MALKDKAHSVRSGFGEVVANKKASLLKSSTRYVLFIGDEGAILVYLSDNVVKSRQYIPDTSTLNLENLRETIIKDTKAALLVVVDTIDQSYIQQTLPPVSSMSIKKLIRRRLERDFAANDIKGAVILGREAAGRKDWNFMMISLERTPLLNTWIEFIESLPNRLQGFYLVAAEAEILLRQLEKQVGKSSNAEWKFFVSHNKVSGFRQVILHKGRVVFTRMSQPLGESTPEVMAGNIEQEMLSTIEYMRRLSFDPQQGLDVYIVASGAIRSAIDNSKFSASVKQMHVLTPYEVAEHLDIEGATQPADQFGDVVLAANIGRSLRHVLTLHTPQSQKFSQLYQAMLGQRLAAGVLIGMVVLYALSIFVSMYGTFLDAGRQETMKIEQQKKLDLIRLVIRQSALDVEKTNDLIDLYSQLEKERFSPLLLLSKIQGVLKPATVTVKGIELSYDEPKSNSQAAAQFGALAGQNLVVSGGDVPANIVASLTLEFPAINTLEAFKPVSTQMLADLRQALPGFDIAFTRLPNIFSEDEKLDMTFGGAKGAAQNGNVNQSLDVVISISGNAGLYKALADSPAPVMQPSAGEQTP